jgi:glucose/arabinose dehydrogenase/mono/diheme cytochrome c family protein
MKLMLNQIRIVLIMLLLSASCYVGLNCGAVSPVVKSRADSVRIGYNTIISNLEVPWQMLWGPDNRIWYSEQNGSISSVNPLNGDHKLMLKIGDYYRKRLGLLSMVLHSRMKENPYLFVYYSFLKDKKAFTKLVRYTWKADSLILPQILLEMPAHTGHMGARLAIGPDDKLMLATGDLTDAKAAQNPNTLNGKILRINLDGSVPEDNPQKGSYVWAKGFRVPQGLTFGAQGLLYTSEHGDATDDEVNLITRNGNYGYPNVTGICDSPAEKIFSASNQVTDPLKAWTPTIAPSSIAYYGSSAIPQWKNSLLVTTLKESDLRILKLNEAGDKIISENIYLDQQFGRLRDVCVSPAGEVFVSTSHHDWNRTNKYSNEKDDRIIRIAPLGKSSAQNEILISNADNAVEKQVLTGKALYNQYCASCHKEDGNGLPGVFPPLRDAEQVLGENKKLIEILLNGISGPIKVKGKEYDQQMPAFGFLKDQELAEIISYVRSNFTRAQSSITPEEIRNLRKLK